MTTIYVNVYDEDAKVEALKMARSRRLMWVSSARLVNSAGELLNFGYAMKFQDKDELDWEMKKRKGPAWEK